MTEGAVAIRGNVHFCLAPGGGNPELLDAFMSAPQSFVENGEVCKPGSRGFAVMAEIAGRSCFIKHYRCLGWGYRLRNALRPSRAARTFAVSRRLLALGVPVPAPFFWVETRRLRLLEDAYFVTEFVASSVNLREFWDHADSTGREAVLQCCAQVLGRMHAAGCCHGDLKWNNLLVQNEDPLQIVLVDLDGASCRSVLSRERRENDLKRFIRDLNDADPTGEYKKQFIREWKRWTAVP